MPDPTPPALQAHLFQQGSHIGPELLPLLAFLRRQCGQCFRLADAGEVGVLLPVGKPLRYCLAGSRDCRIAGRNRQVGLQPVEGKPAEPGSLLVVEHTGVTALAGGVAVPRLELLQPARNVPGGRHRDSPLAESEA
jgi:hypothetical protein